MAGLPRFGVEILGFGFVRRGPQIDMVSKRDFAISEKVSSSISDITDQKTKRQMDRPPTSAVAIERYT
jgi:hypothetical protein